MARVLATGADTALGRIGTVLAAVRPEPTRIQGETTRLVRRLAWCGATERADNTRIRNDAWRLARRGPDGHNARDGDPTGGTARHAHHLSGARRMAHREEPRADATRARTGDARVGDRAVCGQDRHADREPHDRRRAHDRRETNVTATPDAALPEQFHVLLEYAMLASQRDPFDPMDQAIKAATTRFLFAPSTSTSTGRWSTSIRSRPSSWPISRVWQSPDRRHS